MGSFKCISSQNLKFGKGLKALSCVSAIWGPLRYFFSYFQAWQGSFYLVGSEGKSSTLTVIKSLPAFEDFHSLLVWWNRDHQDSKSRKISPIEPWIPSLPCSIQNWNKTFDCIYSLKLEDQPDSWRLAFQNEVSNVSLHLLSSS